MKIPTWSVAVFGILCFACTSAGKAAENIPRVVASIKPIHALVSAIMTGIGTPHLLILSTDSPHTYQLKPSGARLLAKANIIFWIGPTMESFLEKALQTLPQNAQVVSLLDSPRVNLLTAPIDHISHSHEENESVDMHAWLDPTNARAMAAHIATVLTAIDAANSRVYGQNAITLDGRLAELDRRLTETLRPVLDHTYIVFHDAYQYFEKRYNLSKAFAINTNLHQLPGAKRISTIREKIRELGSVCIFVEPQFSPTLMKTITENTGARIAVLDPLGAALKPEPELYFYLLEGMANDLMRCLGTSS